jgi:hypothetical protein
VGIELGVLLGLVDAKARGDDGMDVGGRVIQRGGLPGPGRARMAVVRVPQRLRSQAR